MLGLHMQRRNRNMNAAEADAGSARSRAFVSSNRIVFTVKYDEIRYEAHTATSRLAAATSDIVQQDFLF